MQSGQTPTLKPVVFRFQSQLPSACCVHCTGDLLHPKIPFVKWGRLFATCRPVVKMNLAEVRRVSHSRCSFRRC